MNQEIKKLWLEALRSGQYEQGKCVLRRNNEFCCLGVLCDLHAKQTGREWVQKENSDLYMYEDNSNVPQSLVNAWSGLYLADTEIEYANDRYSLMHLNDHIGLAFSEIADLIEAQI